MTPGRSRTSVCCLGLVASLLPHRPAATTGDAGAQTDKGCTITAKVCKNFPEFERTQFRDSVGEQHLGAGENDAACMKRAEDLHFWCGNGLQDGAQVAATYNPTDVTQIFHPGACERGWSQWDAFCYRHYWEKRNWFDAERLCRDRGGHLVSVHSRAENRFVYVLTQGLSAWIGYSDLDQDTHYKWSDSTQDDFSNFAKNCTGRENDTDCKPEEKKQQWYDWQGGDEGTFVCKRNAILPVSLLHNTSRSTLTATRWEELLPVIIMGKSNVMADNLSTAMPAVPELKNPELSAVIGKGDAPRGEKASTLSVPVPKLVAPKGTLF